MLFTPVRPLLRIPVMTRAPSLVLNFTQGNFSECSFVRASSATRINRFGVLETMTSGQARIDHEMGTLAVRGLLIEESRTNSIRNNTAGGAVVGTPGTLPTNWVFTATGLTASIAGLGTDSGIDYVDIRFSGTSGATQTTLDFDGLTSPAATNAQLWAGSCYVKIVAGNLNNITSVGLAINEKNSGGAVLATTTQTFTPTSSWARASVLRTLNQATVASAPFQIQLNHNNGVAIDVTLRLGLPQMEQGAFATSVIRTTGAAATRAADQVTISTLGSWFNPNEGTVMMEFMTAPGIAASGGQRIRLFEFNDGTSNNRIHVARNTTDATMRYIVTVAGASVADITIGTVTSNSRQRAACAYKLNDFSGSYQGASSLLDNSGAVPVLNTLRLGLLDSVSGFWGGTLCRFLYWPVRLPDAVLQTISA